MELFAGNFLIGIASVLSTILSLYGYVVLAAVVLSWINPSPHNPVIQNILRVIHTLTEPVFYKIRKAIPFTYTTGLDFSPIILLLGIHFLRIFLVNSLYQLAGAM